MHMSWSPAHESSSVLPNALVMLILILHVSLIKKYKAFASEFWSNIKGMENT